MLLLIKDDGQGNYGPVVAAEDTQVLIRFAEAEYNTSMAGLTHGIVELPDGAGNVWLEPIDVIS